MTLLVTETTGALSPTFDRALRALGKLARAPTTHDSTRYGLSRSSPWTFLVLTIARLQVYLAVKPVGVTTPFLTQRLRIYQS